MVQAQNDAPRAPQPRMIDLLARHIGTSELFPRKMRSFVLKKLVGDQQQVPGIDFEVDLGGKKYVGNTSSHIDWHVYYFGCYDPVGVALLRRVAASVSPSVFLDVGANTGTHTLAVLDLCSQIHCFEPYEPVRRTLENNLEINLADNVHVHSVGLSDTNRNAPFQPNEVGNDGAGTFEVQQNAGLNLPLRNGDDYLSQWNLPRVDVIKIDVEGHEFQVLTGLKNTLLNYRPIILWEYNASRELETRTIPEIKDHLPPEYETLLAGFQSRWNRNKPRLTEIAQESRGNLLSIPHEKLHIVKELRH